MRRDEAWSEPVRSNEIVPPLEDNGAEIREEMQV
jgi:hypothetical protein